MLLLAAEGVGLWDSASNCSSEPDDGDVTYPAPIDRTDPVPCYCWRRKAAASGTARRTAPTSPTTATHRPLGQRVELLQRARRRRRDLPSADRSNGSGSKLLLAAEGIGLWDNASNCSSEPDDGDVTYPAPIDRTDPVPCYCWRRKASASGTARRTAPASPTTAT
ncbi:hypothetical protein ACJJTC_002892 [Scirpophaga incertulas]